MNLRRISIALIAGALVAAGVYAAVETRTRSEGTVDVLVAARDLPARAILDEGALRVETVPRYAVAPGTLASTREAVGRVLRDPVYAGGVIREQHLAAQGRDLSASLLIPPDKVYAFNLPVSLFLSAPPRLQLHDRIDIVGYLQGQPLESSGVIVANLEIIDLSTRSSENASETTFLTVGATADDIVRILAARQGYSLAIALRPYVQEPAR